MRNGVLDDYGYDDDSIVAEVQNPVLRSMCCGLLRLLEKVYGVINLAAIFEEEDINMTTYGFTLSPNISDKVLLSQLKAEMDKAKSSDNSEVTQLALRFSILFSLLNCLNTLVASNEMNQATNVLGGKQANSGAFNDLKTMSQTLDQVSQKLKKMKRAENVDEFLEADFAKTGYSTVLGFDSCLNQHLLPPTFPKAAAFPSWSKMVEYLSVCVCSLREACLLVSNNANCFLSTLINFVSCSSAAPKSNLLERSLIQCAIFAFPSPASGGGGNSKGGSGSSLNSSSKPHLIGMPIEDLVAKSISASVSHLPFSTEEETISRVKNQFLSASVRPIAMLIKCYGKNRARVRERLISANQELFQLESLCIALDNAVNNLYVAVNLDKGPLSHRVYSWLSLQASSVMQDFVFLGFELELYSEHELLYIFWYLADFLMIWSCSLQKERLEKFSDELLSRPSAYSTSTSSERPFFKTQRKEDTESAPGGSSSNHGKRNKQYQKLVKQREIEMATQSAMLYETQAHQLKYLQSLLSLFCGYYKTLILLKAADKLMVVSEKAFDCEKLRFEHRFCPIALEPDCFPSYDLFSNAVSSHVESARKQPHLVLAQAADSFSDAKTLLSDIRTCSTVPHETQLMFKISSNNLIVLNLVQKQLQSKMQNNDLLSEDPNLVPSTSELKEKLKFKIEFEPNYSNWPVFKLDSSR